MSDYERGICCICHTPITIESGCAPICDSTACDAKYETGLILIEASKQLADKNPNPTQTKDK